MLEIQIQLAEKLFAHPNILDLPNKITFAA